MPMVRHQSVAQNPDEHLLLSFGQTLFKSGVFGLFIPRAALTATFNRDANGVRENNGSLPLARSPLASRLNETVSLWAA